MLHQGTTSTFLCVSTGCGGSAEGNDESDGDGTKDLLTNVTKDAFDTSSTPPVLQSFSPPSQVLTLHIENL